MSAAQTKSSCIAEYTHDILNPKKRQGITICAVFDWQGHISVFEMGKMVNTNYNNKQTNVGEQSMIYWRLTAELKDRWAKMLAEKVQRCRNGVSPALLLLPDIILSSLQKKKAASPVNLCRESRAQTDASVFRGRWLRVAFMCRIHLNLHSWFHVAMQPKPAVFY